MPTPDSLSDALVQQINALPVTGRPRVLGLSGPQGCGKSTAVEALSAAHDRCIVLGLDDFYLTLAQRRQLARSVSPLFETRGPPGTHDLERLVVSLEELVAGRSTTVPVFSKKEDDRCAERQIPAPPPDAIIVLEGWMIGALATPDFASAPAINALEASSEAQAWREYQQAQLCGPYQRLWDRIDFFVHVSAPSFDCVLHWRTQQEASNLGVEQSDLSVERTEWVAAFVQYYERVTRAMSAGSRCPGAVINVDEERRVIDVLS